MTSRVEFRHGLGDTVYFALQMALYRRRGWDLEVQCNADRRIFYEAAGVKTDCDGKGGAKVPWDHAPRPAPKHIHPPYMANKAAFNIGRPPMPTLDDEPAVMWREFCESKLNMAPLILAETWGKVDDFLRSLRKPVLLIHTIGNSFQDAKSLNKGVTLDLYRALLDGMDGTLLLLDWDNRVPRLASHRVRHLTDDWERIEIPALLALLYRSELLIGIDSGPMHCAHITGTPGLVVFPKQHHVPSSYMLPRSGLACVTPKSESWHSNRVYRHTYNIIEDSGSEISGAFIARQALRMLNGPRYFRPDQIGADAQLQHFVDERVRGRRSTLTEYVDRHRGFDVMLSELRARCVSPIIVETGCVRQEEDWSGAGQSTSVFAAFVAATGGQLVSVDHDAKHCALARSICWEIGCVEVIESEAVAYLRRHEQLADLLYCDSVETTHPNAAEHYLEEAKAGVRFLAARGMIAFDDTVYRARQFHGNGKLAVPWLLDQGWHIVFSGYQTIVSRC